MTSVSRSITLSARLQTILRTMDAHKVVNHPNLDQILQADAWAWQEAAS